MAETKLCVACAEEIKAEARLCKHCNTAQDDPRWSSDIRAEGDDTVLLAPSEQRVPQGSMSAEEWDERTSISVEKDSEELKASATPFDPSIRPQPDDLVPADCIWAVYPWPGPLPSNLMPGTFSTPNPQKFFTSLGNVRGWTYAEFETCAGVPFTTMPSADGGRTLVWSHGSLFGAWSASFYFDRYGICLGIGSETNF